MPILLTKDVERALNYAVHAKPELEVGGFARVEPHEKGLLLTDILIPPQLVGSASVHMGEQIPELGMSGFEWTMVELAKRGETLSDWNCWWHSHSTMDTFASPTDEETLETFAEMVEPLWALGLVVNTRGHYYSWMHDVRPPWRTSQKKIDVVLEKNEIVQPLFGNIMKMMEEVQPASPASHPLFVPSRDFGSIQVVWCDEHMEFSDKCPIKHIPPSNRLCQHTPNCGGKGCFSKAERKRMNQTRRGRKAGERNYHGSEILLGIDADDKEFEQIDWDKWDADIEAAFEVGEAARYA